MQRCVSWDRSCAAVPSCALSAGCSAIDSRPPLAACAFLTRPCHQMLHPTIPHCPRGPMLMPVCTATPPRYSAISLACWCRALPEMPSIHVSSLSPALSLNWPRTLPNSDMDTMCVTCPGSGEEADHACYPMAFLPTRELGLQCQDVQRTEALRSQGCSWLVVRLVKVWCGFSAENLNGVTERLGQRQTPAKSR